MCGTDNEPGFRDPDAVEYLERPGKEEGFGDTQDCLRA